MEVDCSKSKNAVSHRDSLEHTVEVEPQSMAVSFITFKVNGYTSIFFAMFSKRDNFCLLFAYLEDVVFSNWGLLLKERICSHGSKFFSL